MIRQELTKAEWDIVQERVAEALREAAATQKHEPVFPTSYRFVDTGEWPSIDGVVFPWSVSGDPGPMVAPTRFLEWHILWVPILVNAPLPSPPVGTPEGEPLPTERGV